MDHIQINAIEKFHFDNFTRIAQDSNFKSDLDSIEKRLVVNKNPAICCQQIFSVLQSTQ